MAGTGSPTGTIQHRLLVGGAVLGATAVGEANTAAKVKALVTTALALSAPVATGALTEVKDCVGGGPLDASGNPVTYTPWGSGVGKSIAGVAELGEVAFRYVATETDAVHAKLGDLATIVGKGITVIVVKKISSAETYYVMSGTVSGGSVGLETPAENEFRVAISSGPTRYDAP